MPYAFVLLWSCFASQYSGKGSRTQGALMTSDDGQLTIRTIQNDTFSTDHHNSASRRPLHVALSGDASASAEKGLTKFMKPTAQNSIVSASYIYRIRAQGFICFMKISNQLP